MGICDGSTSGSYGVGKLHRVCHPVNCQVTKILGYNCFANAVLIGCCTVFHLGNSASGAIINGIAPWELVAAELAVWFGLSIPPFAVIEKCEIEIRMKDWAHRMKAPLFFSKKVDGFPRDGSATIISKLRHPHDISKLVVFDTWIRNTDRYSPGIANSDNLLFVRRGNQ